MLKVLVCLLNGKSHAFVLWCEVQRVRFHARFAAAYIVWWKIFRFDPSYLLQELRSLLTNYHDALCPASRSRAHLAAAKKLITAALV